MSINASTSPQMERIVKQLAATYGVDLSRKCAQLSLDMPTRADRWLMANLDGTRISVTHCVVEEGDCLRPDLDMVFALTPHGWEPVELLHTDAVWKTYVRAAKAAGIAVYDAQGDALFAHFTEYWAQHIAAQGWLEHGRTVAGITTRQAHAAAEARCTRLPGCQSTHPGACYGELWPCSSCGKTVCYAEGSDHHPELCDACWAERYAAPKEDNDVPC
jgi:hypothetical protein